MSFNLFTSNRLEILSEALIECLNQPLASPFDEEIVVVQSKGMERWISLQLAQRQGICANVDFPFPNAFIYKILRTVFSDLPEKSVYEPNILTWRIMKILPGCLDRASFLTLNAYLDEPGSGMKRLQLAARIADLFDQYLLFRPEMILRWEKGEENHWQAELWREVSRGHEKQHRAALGKRLIATLQNAAEMPNLPARIAVFGISALPEFHMQVFSALAGFSEVNLFLMNPCKEYWGDIISDSEIRRTTKTKKDDNFTLDLFHFAKGNALLASMGKLGRDFFDLMEDFNYIPFREFREPGEKTLLGCLQSDILNLRDRTISGDKKMTIADSDRSIQIHSCHSPRREIEVLQDHILDMFESDPTLKPGDILVMAPDIEPYAPYIQAVFDLAYDDPKRIPYSISDRSYGRENEIVETLFAFLDLHGSRFGASQVLTVLEAPAVRKKFDLSEDDLDLIQTWLRETRIRWGKNAHERGQLGLPENPQNTWQVGLERLLLGYALPGHDEKLYDETIIPYDHVEGGQTSTLGKFLEFTEQLFNRIDSLTTKRTLENWNDELNKLLDTFFETDNDLASEIQVIRRVLAEFDDFQTLCEFDEHIDLRVVKHHLEAKLHKEGYGYGFLTGGITFCSMLPMRSIPARAICLVGMNSDAYPRRTRQLGFDLMAQKPKKGDRSRRNDDRYLFLEALISAREKLYISYVGQSAKDNSIIPPSVLVSELLDYIDSNFEIESADIRKQIKCEHRLQAFSPEYFQDSEKFFSYSSENMHAAQCLLEPRAAPEPFISQELPEPEEEFKTISLSDLYRFFRNPTRFLLNRRLGLYLEDKDTTLQETEAFALQGLDRYDVAQYLLGQTIEGRDRHNLKKLKMASGQLPHGAIGEFEYDSLSRQMQHFVTKTERHITGAKLAPLEIDLPLAGFHLTGKIDNITEAGMAHYRYARVRAKDHLRVWLFHLALNSMRSHGYPLESFLAGIDSNKSGNWMGWSLKPVATSDEILTQLLEVYWQGLKKPVRFFPDSALAYARAIYKSGKFQTAALWSARKNWFGSDLERGEREDLYFQLCFGKEDDPFNSEFEELARKVFEPLFGNEEEIE